jgi:hypothetical protein
MIEFLESPIGLWIRVVFSLLLSLWLFHTGLWPNPDHPKGYDRAIRILGGMLFGSGALFGIARIMGWVD